MPRIKPTRTLTTNKLEEIDANVVRKPLFVTQKNIKEGPISVPSGPINNSENHSQKEFKEDPFAKEREQFLQEINLLKKEIIPQLEQKLRASESSRIEDVKKLASTIQSQRQEYQKLLEHISREKDELTKVCQQLKIDLDEQIKQGRHIQVSNDALLEVKIKQVDVLEKKVGDLQDLIEKKDASINTLKREKLMVEEESKRKQNLVDNLSEQLEQLKFEKEDLLLKLDREREKVALQRGYMMSRFESPGIEERE